MMNAIKKIIYITFAIFLIGCEEFLEIVPQDQVTMANYYETEAQCLGATAPLYGFVWFNFLDKASYAIGDVYAGNMYSENKEQINFNNYTVNQNNVRVFEAWSACYSAIAHSNSTMHNLPRKATKNGVDQTVINNCVAEAKFMRATAYFYLVQLFGPIPLIEEGVKASENYLIPRIIEEDVFSLIIKDLEWAEANSPDTRPESQKGRITKTVAKAMKAKVYLTIKEYDKCKIELEAVINSGKYRLLDNYKDLFFKSTSNFNDESLFAWTWEANSDWGSQNTHQSFFAINSDITTVGDGWGVVVPTVDLLNAFEPGDLRKREILMEDGDYYPELRSDIGGFTYDQTKYNSRTHAGIKKYVVGSPADDDVSTQYTGINTDILRYADVLLMYVEAMIGNGTSTTDATALQYFNMIRKRAGLAELTEVTKDILLQERRIEFAFEKQFYYDLLRIKGETETKTILSNVERGTFGKNGFESKKFVCKDVRFGIPVSEIDQNPLLAEDPVNYNWSESEYNN